MRENPLWLVFMISTIVFLYLSMNISADHEADVKSPKRNFHISISILVIISAVIGTFVSITDGFQLLDGVMMGGLFFICGLVPISYIYYLRKKRFEDNDTIIF